jgi:anti-sigma factor ChrR (cupin superfamily)
MIDECWEPSMLAVYALGVLDEDESAAMEPHLVMCAACAAEVHDLVWVRIGLEVFRDHAQLGNG